MHIDTNLNGSAVTTSRSTIWPASLEGPDNRLSTRETLGRVLRLLGSANLRLSLFSFETLPGAVTTAQLFSAVEAAVDDAGLAFELDDGRVGALVYGWRPPDADDSWVEDRTLARLDWAFGGPRSSADFVDVYAVHRWSGELSDGNDIKAALAFGEPVRHVRPHAHV